MGNHYNLNVFLQKLDSLGVTDIVLPFLLVFVLLFAILQKTKILGEDKKNFNAVIALVIGLLFVIPHATGSYLTMGFKKSPVDIINTFLPGIALVIIAVVMLFILIGLWGGEAKWVGGTPSAMIAILAMVAIVWIFGASAGWWQGWNPFVRFFGEEAVAVIVIIIVFALIIWFITKSDTRTEGEGFMERFGNMFKR